MSDIIAIALNKLDVDPLNVRKTYSVDSIEALAASILANGLLQNIVVRKAPKGCYLVSAGGRRFAALKLLAERAEIATDYAVDARVKNAEDATEISLTENVMREAMHPADQYEAFKRLADEGRSVKDIAARFGTTEVIVNRRLALAKVSPVLLALYRQEEMTYEQLAAFTVTDDHARQDEVWAALPSWDRSAHAIKRRLAADEVPASDKRLAFLGGLEVYAAAGGPVRRDLFEDQGGFACDSGLLETLVVQKLEAVAEQVKAEGWKWVDTATQQPENLYRMHRVYPQRVDLSEADQAALDALSAQYDELAELIEAGEAGDGAEVTIEAIEEQIKQLRDGGEAYQAEDLAMAGAFVTLDYYGQLAVLRGMVRDEDRKAATADESGGINSGVDSKTDSGNAGGFVHSATLIEDLTAQKTAALRIELANNPEIALVSVVHAMLLDLAYRGPYGARGGQSALQITMTHEKLEPSMKQPAENKALQLWESLAENYGDKLPGNPADLWDWLFEQSRDELLNLLAYAAAHTVNAVEQKYSGHRKQAFAHADQLAQALNVKMGDYFTPTAASYFNHLNRAGIEAVVAEVRGADFASGIAAMKKRQAADFAEKAVEGSGWLPPHIRIAPVLLENDGEESQNFSMAAE
ncbi:ParB/RepB/Spo0J family partition protein [Neorhizobium sp. T786]|uniref:ParB/RepB/Spo0J family partition protein n=1 Tax=Pseudorhizobium xiangyangii TaxID=2883104 RepID=UPI001CFFDFE1|nr:ParB/RepB/Spo0J family partition protein [Neorhizobium xiangyangii]MCB5205154.1 ParB/RepB/Spo0J family partition protein [Neorhizobium xiangyangii]